MLASECLSPLEEESVLDPRGPHSGHLFGEAWDNRTMTHPGLFLLCLLTASHRHAARTWRPSANGMDLPEEWDVVPLNSILGLSFPLSPSASRENWKIKDRLYQTYALKSAVSEVPPFKENNPGMRLVVKLGSKSLTVTPPDSVLGVCGKDAMMVPLN